MIFTTTIRSIALAAMGAALVLPAPMVAAEYPVRPIRLVLGFTAAGSTDIIARILAEHASRRLGQQIIVENRPGAGGNLGTDLVARAAPDGYTLTLCTIGTCAINSAIYPKLNYNIERDFVPIILTGSVSNILAVNNDVPARTVKELVALAKTKPGGLTYASSGFGTSPHLNGELLKDMANIEAVHVPYKGSAPAIIDLRGGQTHFFFDNAPSILPHVKAGAVRAVAVTGPKRIRALPNVPTMEEAGFPGFVLTAWWGLLAPAKTPPNIIAMLNKVMNEVLNDPAVHKKLEDQEFEVIGGTPQRLADHIRSENAKWTKLVKQRGIQAEQ